MPTWLDTRGAAAMLGVSPAYLRWLVWDGQLAASKAGWFNRYRLIDVQKLARDRARAGRTGKGGWPKGKKRGPRKKSGMRARGTDSGRK